MDRSAGVPGPRAGDVTAAGDSPVPRPAGARLEDQLRWYDRKSVAAQRKYKGMKLLQLVAAAAVSVSAAAGGGAALAAALGGLLLVLEGVQQLGQYYRIWIDYRSTWELLQREKFLFLSHAAQYARARDPARLLAERVEMVLSRETAGWSAIQEAAAKEDEERLTDAR